MKKLRAILEENNTKIATLLSENREISITLWEHQFKERLGRESYLSLDTIMMLFNWDNDRKASMQTFEREVYSAVNTPLTLLERAKKYGLRVPEVVLDITCSLCACRNCEMDCGCCEQCRANYGERYSSYCDE